MPQTSSGYIDLHAHTTASDGSYTPRELVTAALETGLETLAITDHDTFDGYQEALDTAAGSPDLELVQGIELNSRWDLPNGQNRTVHVLGYWPEQPPSASFVRWLSVQQQERRDRNRRLIGALRSRNVDIQLEEVEALGRSLTGRPHFAKVLVRKGYARSADEAFQRYLGETAPTYVERQSVSTAQAVQMIRQSGGAPVIAHPIRINLVRGDEERNMLRHLKDAGLFGLEVWHSEHSEDLQRHYLQMAEELELLPTGGSDFHGTIKPDIRLGSGRDGNVKVPAEYWKELRTAFRAASAVTP